MAEYIDRAQVLQFLRRCTPTKWEGRLPDGRICHYSDVIDGVTAIPTADSEPVTVLADRECSVKAFDGENRVCTYRCAPCPRCGKWLTVNPAHHFCEYCGLAVQFEGDNDGATD